MARLTDKLGSSYIYIYIAALLSSLSLFSFLILSSSTTSADTTPVSTSATAAVTVPDTCTIAGNIPAGSEHTKTVNPGTYEPNIGTTNVSIVCNDRNGFSVYAIGYSNNVDGNTNLIGTNTNLLIPTGTSTNTTVSNWAMKLSPVTGTYTPTILSDASGSYANYHIIPSTATKVVTYTGDINTSSTARFNTTYAVAVSPTQAADTYIGKVKYTVVHPNYSNADGTIPTYTVNLGFTYADSIIIDGTSYPSSTTSVTLAHGNHTISGTYPVGFTSWSSTDGVTVASTSSANTTITITGAGTLILTGEEPKLYMWDASSADCGTTMYDNRDGTERAYTTAKIGSLCWMTTNLSLGASTKIVLTDATSNVGPSGYTLPASSTSGFSGSAASVYNSNSTICNSTSPCYAYYSWYAATAGSTKTSGNADYDICPKAWRLPTKAEYDTLTSTVGANIAGSPFMGVRAGEYYSSSFHNGGYGGYYWSSTAFASGGAYPMSFTSGAGHTYQEIMGDGYGVRCVAKS